MVRFKINFEFQGGQYEANVQKLYASQIQYLVTGFTPVNNSFPNQYLFVWDQEKRELQYSLNPDVYTLGGSIATAILVYCRNNGVEIGK